MRLIDADKLKKHYAWWTAGESASEINETYKEIFDACIDAQPTIDAVEVVRCEDCKHYWKNHIEIDDDTVAVCLASPKDDAFCSEGERRDDGEIHQG